MENENSKSGLGRRDLLKLSAIAGAAVAGATLVGRAPASAADSELTLKGKRIGISATGTDHFFDLQAYNAQIAEVKRLGGEPIAVDGSRNDGKLVAQLQTLIAQKPDAIVQTLGTLSVIDPWLKKARDAGIPVLTVDVGSTNSLNNTTSDNWGIGKDLALQLVSDIGGEGNIVVFNGFYGVTPCAIRYDQLVNVVKYFPKVKILQPELRDVIPNTVQDAFTQITALLNKYPEKGSIKAIWSAWDIPQLGATYGVDGSPEVLQLVADANSPAGGNVAQQPAEIGRTAIQNVAKFLAGQTLPRETYVPALLANKVNVNDVTKKLGIG
jgi:ribose transport system substrate-binding protein